MKDTLIMSALILFVCIGFFIVGSTYIDEQKHKKLIVRCFNIISILLLIVAFYLT